MRRFTAVLAFVLLNHAALPVLAAAKPFSDSREIDLLRLLPPPQAANSATMRAELGEVLKLQASRTPEMVARAVADTEENIWRFADAMANPKFAEGNLPKFAAFFDRVVATEAAVVDPAKKVWKRPRPHMVSPLVKPVVRLSSGGYPSGHATVGTLMGIVLSDMVPEKRDAIMKRAVEFGHNRVVGGIHFPSDVEAGRRAGTAIARTISAHADYKAEFEAAKAELRGVLGI